MLIDLKETRELSERSNYSLSACDTRQSNVRVSVSENREMALCRRNAEKKEGNADKFMIVSEGNSITIRVRGKNPLNIAHKTGEIRKNCSY